MPSSGGRPLVGLVLVIIINIRVVHYVERIRMMQDSDIISLVIVAVTYSCISFFK